MAEDVFGVELQMPRASASYNSANSSQVSGLGSIANFGANVASMFKDFQDTKADAARLVIAQQEQEYKMQQRDKAAQEETDKASIAAEMANLSDVARQAQQGTSTSMSKLELAMQQPYSSLVKRYPSQLEFINSQFKNTVGFDPSEAIYGRRLMQEAEGRANIREARQLAKVELNGVLSYAVQNDLAVFTDDGGVNEQKTFQNIQTLQDVKAGVSQAIAVYKNPESSPEMKMTALNNSIGMGATAANTLLETSLNNGSLERIGVAGVQQRIYESFMQGFEDPRVGLQAYNEYSKLMDIPGTLKRAEESGVAPTKALENKLKLNNLTAEYKLQQMSPALTVLSNNKYLGQLLPSLYSGDKGSQAKATIDAELSSLLDNIKTLYNGEVPKNSLELSPNTAAPATQFSLKSANDPSISTKEGVAPVTAILNSNQVAQIGKEVESTTQQLENSVYTVSKLETGYWNKLEALKEADPTLYKHAKESVVKAGVPTLAYTIAKLTVEGNGVVRFNPDSSSFEILKPTGMSEGEYSYRRVLNLQGFVGDIAKILSPITIAADMSHNVELKKTIKDFQVITDNLRRAGLDDEQIANYIKEIYAIKAGVKRPIKVVKEQEQPLVVTPELPQSE